MSKADENRCKRTGKARVYSGGRVESSETIKYRVTLTNPDGVVLDMWEIPVRNGEIDYEDLGWDDPNIDAIADAIKKETKKK